MSLQARRILFVLLMTSWPMGCRSTWPAPDPVAGKHSPTPLAVSIDQGLLETAFRYALTNAPQDEPLFISQTRIGENAIDPPAGVLIRLADLNLDLKPASHAKRRSNEAIFDRSTGK